MFPSDQTWTTFQSDLVVGLILALMTLGFGLLILVVQLRAARALARQQGNFRVPRLHGFLISQKLHRRVLIALRFNQNRPMFVSMPLAIVNSGNKAARGVTAFVKVPRIMAKLSDIRPYDDAIAALAGIKMATHVEKESTTYIFSWPTVAPTIPQVTRLPIYIPSASLIKLESVVRTKDDVAMQVTAEALFRFPISVLLADEDGQTVSFSHSFEIVDGGESDLRSHVENQTRQAVANPPVRPPESRWTRFKHGWLYPRKSTTERVHAFVLREPHPIVEYPEGDLFEFYGASLSEGLVEEGRYFIPALRTSFFGDDPPSGLAEIYAKRTADDSKGGLSSD